MQISSESQPQKQQLQVTATAAVPQPSFLLDFDNEIKMDIGGSVPY